MSTAPSGPTEQVVSKGKFKECWSCRVISGSGIIGAAAYVFMAARKDFKLGGPVPMSTVAQLTLAACLASWGFVVLANPVGKSRRATDP